MIGLLSADKINIRHTVIYQQRAPKVFRPWNNPSLNAVTIIALSHKFLDLDLAITSDLFTEPKIQSRCRSQWYTTKWEFESCILLLHLLCKIPEESGSADKRFEIALAQESCITYCWLFIAGVYFDYLDYLFTCIFWIVEDLARA